jgi:hypothetical protein
MAGVEVSTRPVDLIRLAVLIVTAVLLLWRMRQKRDRP